MLRSRRADRAHDDLIPRCLPQSTPGHGSLGPRPT